MRSHGPRPISPSTAGRSLVAGVVTGVALLMLGLGIAAHCDGPASHPPVPTVAPVPVVTVLPSPPPAPSVTPATPVSTPVATQTHAASPTPAAVPTPLPTVAPSTLPNGGNAGLKGGH